MATLVDSEEVKSAAVAQLNGYLGRDVSKLSTVPHLVQQLIRTKLDMEEKVCPGNMMHECLIVKYVPSVTMSHFLQVCFNINYSILYWDIIVHVS